MKMTLQFLGAAQEVTGSCHLLTINGRQILLDCGLIQGSKADELRNHDPFEFYPKNLSAVILSHAHIDHSGRLPLLVKSGFNGPIYTHKATAELCEIMLKDAAMLQAKETERTNKKRIRKNLMSLEPLFTVDDVMQVMGQFVALDYQQIRNIIPHVSTRLSDSGHILGSAIVEVWLGEQAEQKKLVFSGDLGRPDMPILEDPTFIKDADLVLMESTYGNRLHRPWQETLAELKDIFAKTIKQGRGNILLPAFSIGRAQELLYLFHLYAKEWDLSRWKVCLDSPMAIEATKVYINNYPLMDEDFKRFTRQHPSEHPLLFEVEFVETTEESMQLNDIPEGLIIIAGSGMCNGGRIRCHFTHNLWRPECDIIICGFQAIGTPGRALVDGVSYLNVQGKSLPVEAKIHTIGGLSAHADQAGLLRWYLNFSDHPPLILVHGEPKSQQTLLDEVLQRTQPNQASVVAVERGQTLDLTTLPLLTWL